jgi:hypothetical protein
MKLTIDENQPIYFLMNDLFFFTAVCNASVKLLQNENPYLSAIVVSYTDIKNDNTEVT